MNSSIYLKFLIGVFNQTLSIYEQGCRHPHLFIYNRLLQDPSKWQFFSKRNIWTVLDLFPWLSKNKPLEHWWLKVTFNANMAISLIFIKCYTIIDMRINFMKSNLKSKYDQMQNNNLRNCYQICSYVQKDLVNIWLKNIWLKKGLIRLRRH